MIKYEGIEIMPGVMKDYQEGDIMFELTEEQRKQLLQYLWTRPYGEVTAIISMLASLKSKKNDTVTPKK